MNIDRLNRLSSALRSHEFPENTSFNLCYFRKEFAVGDLKMDEDGDLYDHHMDVKLHANGTLTPPSWCGTLACNAGITIMLFFPLSYWIDGPRVPAYSLAQEILGLTNDEAEDLFIPDPQECPYDWEKITPEQSADVVDNLIVTGRVNWHVIG